MLLMKKLIGIFVFSVLCSASVMAQGYARFDFSGGGSFRAFTQTQTSDGATIGMPGWYASLDYNIHRFRNHFGLEIEGSGNYRNQIVLGPTSVYTLLVGPKIYPFGHHKLTPFGHVLYGAAYYRDGIPAQNPFDYTLRQSSSKAWEAGGGLDLNIRKHWGVRMLQVDYGQTDLYFLGARSTQNNYRASIGINYRFGGR
jgi:hypothetical protein